MTKEKDFNKPMMRIFISYFGAHKKLFLIDMSCAFLIAAIDVAFPLVSRYAMYELLPGETLSCLFYSYGYNLGCFSPQIGVLLYNHLSRTQIRYFGGG